MVYLDLTIIVSAFCQVFAQVNLALLLLSKQKWKFSNTKHVRDKITVKPVILHEGEPVVTKIISKML